MAEFVQLCVIEAKDVIKISEKAVHLILVLIVVRFKKYNAKTDSK